MPPVTDIGWKLVIARFLVNVLIDCVGVAVKSGFRTVIFSDWLLVCAIVAESVAIIV